MATDRVIELKRILDAQARMPRPENEPNDDEAALFEEAIGKFLSAGPEVLEEATEALWAYYRSVASAFTDAERLAYGIPEIPPVSEIWDYVDFREPPWIQLGGDQLEPAPTYVSFEREVNWEPEHGLQVVFEHGHRVCTLGPYDGHNTNAHAFGDGSLLNVVFKE